MPRHRQSINKVKTADDLDVLVAAGRVSAATQKEAMGAASVVTVALWGSVVRTRSFMHMYVYANTHQIDHTTTCYMY